MLEAIVHTLRSAKRMGEAVDTPEGSRYIQLSETLVTAILVVLEDQIASAKEVELEPATEFRHKLLALYRLAKAAKPDDRSENDRHWAIAKTNIEKLIAYTNTWLV